MNKKMPYYMVAAGLFLSLKFFYTTAHTDELTFLLGPVNHIINLITGSQYVYSADAGYFHPDLHIIIDKSCSGFNFWLLCFIMITFLLLKQATSRLASMLAIPLSITVSYILTILVNSFRIFVSMIISRHAHNFLPEKPLHETIGIITNLTFLILIYFIAEKLLNLKKNAQSAQP